MTQAATVASKQRKPMTKALVDRPRANVAPTKAKSVSKAKKASKGRTKA